MTLESIKIIDLHFSTLSVSVENTGWCGRQDYTGFVLQLGITVPGDIKIGLAGAEHTRECWKCSLNTSVIRNIFQDSKVTICV